MTASQIITELYNSPDLDACIKSRRRPSHFPGYDSDWHDELKAEAFRIVCEQPSELIERLYSEKRLVFFIARIILNLSYHQRNVLHKNYPKTVELSGQKYYEQLADEELSIDEVTEALEAMKQKSSSHYYYACILEEYAKLGSYRALAEQTQIAPMSLRAAVLRGRQIVKEMIHEN